MTRRIDETGNVYGRLTVLRQTPARGHRSSAWWLCRCVCGRETVARGDRLRAGGVRSCGCARRGARAAYRPLVVALLRRLGGVAVWAPGELSNADNVDIHVTAAGVTLDE
jgi:hypothetical protein